MANTSIKPASRHIFGLSHIITCFCSNSMLGKVHRHLLLAAMKYCSQLLFFTFVVASLLSPLYTTTTTANAMTIIHMGEQKQHYRQYINLALGLSAMANKVNNNNEGYDVGGEKLDNAITYEGAIGYTINNKFSVEINPFTGHHNLDQSTETLFYNDQKFTKSSVSLGVRNTSLFVNAVFNITHSLTMNPYLICGLGIGYTNTSDYKITSEKDPEDFYIMKKHDTQNIVYNAGAGLKYDISHNAYLTIQYRFIHLGEFRNTNMRRFSNGHMIPLSSRVTEVVVHSPLIVHNLTAGIGFSF